jgi:hypothetical protein
MATHQLHLTKKSFWEAYHISEAQQGKHWQLWWNDRGDDQNTVQQEFTLCHSSLQSYSSAFTLDSEERKLTFNPDIGTGGNSEDE